MWTWVKSYKALVGDDFAPKEARILLYRIFKMKYFPYRLYEIDLKHGAETGEIVNKSRTWIWRGRTLHTKEYTNV